MRKKTVKKTTGRSVKNPTYMKEAAAETMSVKFDAGTHARLDEIKEVIGLKKVDIVKAAVTAAINCIEENDYRVTFPMKFKFDG